MQLGSLCTGLVKVGSHLERNNPNALNRLQASKLSQLISISVYVLSPFLEYNHASLL